MKRWHTSLSKVKAIIAECNRIILSLDALEEKRPLYRPEFNLRKIIKLHLEDVLRLQFIYWKQRCTIRNIKIGEENTKFFHSMATERFRKNTIASLKLENGDIITDHHQMAAVFWQDFKGRMGCSDGIQMGYNLQQLLQKVAGFQDLSKPFSDEEIESIIKQMPPDRAPGPDGFTGLFLKTCWQILKPDFMALVSDFYEGKVDLECINTSLITLIPKKLSPEMVGDYRPISLTNPRLKFLTKLLANRL